MKPRTKVHMHDPTKFTNIYFSKKKHSAIFVHSDLKCPFIKFSINMYACSLLKGIPFSFQFIPEYNILGH